MGGFWILQLICSQQVIWEKGSCQDARELLPTELNESQFTKKKCYLLKKSLGYDQNECLELALLSI